MKIILRTLLILVSGFISTYSFSQTAAQNASYSPREARENFQRCITDIDKSKDGKLVFSQIFISPEPSEREGRIDLLTSQAKLNLEQKDALKKAYQGYFQCRKDLLDGIQNTPYEAIDIKSFNQLDYIIAKLLTGKYSIGEANFELTRVRNQTREEIMLIHDISEDNKKNFQQLIDQLKTQQQMRVGFYQCMAKIAQESEGKLVYGNILVPPNAAGNDKRMELLTSKAKLSNEQKMVLKKMPNRTAICEKDLLIKFKGTPFEAPFIEAFDNVNFIIANLLMDRLTIGDANMLMTENRIKLWSKNISIFNHRIAKMRAN